MNNRIGTENTNGDSRENPVIFLNTPIREKSEDIIGLQAHVDALQAAIDANAQMIAITSPFGAGKSSVTELLRTGNIDQRVMNLSMWSHLCRDNDSESIETTELHRSFLYQIVSHLNAKSGAYISRRLSKSYGLLKLHTESPKYYVVAFLSVLFFVLGYFIPYVLNVGIPTFLWTPEIWNGLFVLLSAICFVYVVIRAEIVFSSNKSEGSLIIDENELKELYRKFVVNPCLTEKKIKKYVFVIEDLDRTDKTDCVVAFLKELRKYYVLENSADNEQNKIVFVVNVKPETSLIPGAKDYKGKENESLYAKLFDFVLNIQTINIDDYETVLESILQRDKEVISAIFPHSNQSRFIDIPGMQWIIRGKRFGIRDIKDRLNRAFTLYVSLRNRFQPSSIDFEKCAVVAYLTTAFEEEFISTDDRAFGELVEADLQHKLDEGYCAKTLREDNKEYVKEVFDLIRAKLIDSNYRMYFYNYPQNSKIYSYDEHAIQNAILYGDEIDGLEDMALRVAHNNVSIIHEALDRVKQLKLQLPDVLFTLESLYLETLRHYPEGVYSWLANLDFSPSSYEKSRNQILRILSFDKERTIYTINHAFHFCEVWEKGFKESDLLQFRQLLCSVFSEEMLWYRQLFMGIHDIAGIDELDLVSITDAIQLINTSKDAFSEEYVLYILERFEKEAILTDKLVNNVQAFLNLSVDNVLSTTMVLCLLRFMQFIGKIIPEFELLVMNQITSPKVSPEEKNKLFGAYQGLIISIESEKITEVTLENIRKINRFEGYSEDVANLLDEYNYVFEANLIRLFLGNPIDFSLEKTITSIKENSSWLLERVDIFKQLRLAVIESCGEDNIGEYTFLFSVECPVITTSEFSNVKYRFSDETILKLIPASIVTDNELPMLISFFNRCFQQNTTAYRYLIYIAGMKQPIARECFYKLNFDNVIKFSTFSAERKKLIKETFGKILGLDAVAEKIKFMFATRFLDSAWEESIFDTIRINGTLQKNYIEAVNNAAEKSLTGSTVKSICSFSTFYSLNDVVTRRLYVAKKYKHYVICKTLYHKRFILDEPEKTEVLWETYMEIFSGLNHRDIREYLDNNGDFLNLIMEKKSYIGLSNERRNVLAKILQDSDLLQDAINRGENFSLNYYQKIEGFANEVAMETFISIIENNPALLRSQAIYDHCHEKLRNSSIKAKYTRLRKKAGYMK